MVSLSWTPKKKGSHIMLKHMVRWIVILATLLIIATVLVLSPALYSHASGVHSSHKTTQTTTATPTPTTTSSGMSPNVSWTH
jgi:FlaG/FlaF family flagellin (archaellin)